MASVSAYKPTSLDVINRPNPVEPQSIPQRHPLNGTPQVPQRSSKDVRSYHDGDIVNLSDRPAKRSKLDDVNSIHLPKLPLRQNTKRLRIPPTLSGLHQPPPNAGLLPSISTEQPDVREKVVEPSVETLAAGTVAVDTSVKVAVSEPTLTKSGRPKRNKWSEEETACLLKGVARFGVGNWTKILKCEDYSFEKRSALDLKDRFRVCCPDDYQRSKKQRPEHPAESADTSKRGSRPSRSDRKSSVELQGLGITQPFAKVERRTRRGYSEVEDGALLRGFTKNGSQWAVIRAEEKLHLGHRTATDLRDRMRTKFPELYAKAGLTPRPEIFPPLPNRGKEDEPARDVVTAAQEATQTAEPAPLAKFTPITHPDEARKQSQSLLPNYEDVFFGAPFEDDDDAQQITLDRGILDWPLDSSRALGFDINRTMTIDPIATLNLPRPTVPNYANSGFSNLPSLAAITAFNEFDFGIGEQLELPSLVLGQLEGDGRSGGHFLGMDEMLNEPGGMWAR
ncbi:hypothetical protein LTR15_008936 [Elasticomyces elasticus]|nr:hypothetical protein LTR15_008936 [Elasticomyces elasticus]